ncbi:uncharacterized protein LOC127260360 [Andrographis paniculata]|uniref:uncharacterized protein LOC127260360 n=1 Tax=Andrographis paniculata TaxID=175694 RepID=UPI0021E8EF96|nr:uncharacterized protein LOC127260360 [Andrographis paniculata]XP_051144044.1 uncharacterized protein LOC127260360 [Andrographis paniculata]
MAVNSAQECPNAHGVAILLGVEHITNASYVDVLNTMKSSTCSNTELKSQNNTNEKVVKADSYVLCSPDIDIEKGEKDSTVIEESAANWKSDDYLDREACLQIGGKFVQLLMSFGWDLPKFTLRDKFAAERVYETPTHRMRKYKRYPSFNSRRVLLLFSILSSLGTMILIYLTLRVRVQINNDGSANNV